MTNAERDTCLRRLRFPDELESAFRFDHFRKTVPALRIGLGLMAVIVSTQLFGGQLEAGGRSLTDPGMILRPLTLLALLGVTFLSGFWRWWQWFFLGLMAFRFAVGFADIESRIAAGSASLDPIGRLFFLGMLTLYGMVILTGVLRLHFGWGAGAQLILAATSLRMALDLVRLPPPQISTLYVLLVLPALVIVLFASYTSERLQRAAFLNSHLLEVERAKSETLLRNTLPDPIVDRLLACDGMIADDHVEVTVLFADIADFTPWAAGKPARQVLEFLNRVFSRFDQLVEARGLEKIKTVGDCYMVVSGAPEARADHVQAAARLALEMRAEAGRMSAEMDAPIRFRIGIHTGPLAAGVIGEKRFLYDVWGDTVNTASRLESQGVPGGIQVSAEVAERLGSEFVLEPRGTVELKGKGEVRTYLLLSDRGKDAEAGRDASVGLAGKPLVR